MRSACFIVLWIIATSARAQTYGFSPSIHFGKICAQCNMSIKDSIDGRVEYYDCSPSLCIQADTEIYNNRNIRFVVDSVNRLFQLYVDSGSDFPVSLPGAAVYGSLSVAFESVPYHDSENTLVANGDYPYNYGYEALEQAPAYYHHWYSGGCTTSGKSHTYLSIQAIPTSRLRVHYSRSLPTLKIIPEFSRIEIICSETTSTQSLFLYNLIGQQVTSLEFSSHDSNSTHLMSLPPGCYFARLSGANGASEVVKFVVAP